MTRRSERGEGKAGCIIGLVFLVLALWIGIKVIPVRVSVASLQDHIEDIASKASLLREQPGGDSKEKQLQYSVLRKAREERLPVKAENVEIVLSEQRCDIKVKYQVDIELGFYTYKWKVEHKIDRIVF